MVSRTILIHGYAKKNKSRRKKYFVISIGPDYILPRIDYYPSYEKWQEHKHEIIDDYQENVSYQSIDLSLLFFVDNCHSNKYKDTQSIELFLPHKHFVLTLSTNELKKKWQGTFENIQYKNSKLHLFPDIEYVIEASLKMKPKEHVDKSILNKLKGNFRVCLMKKSMMFVNKSLDDPVITLQYPFLREWESRFDGTFRIEVGRASLIGECFIILHLSSYDETKLVHNKLKELIECFKIAKPEPPKIRNSSNKRNCPTRNSSIVDSINVRNSIPSKSDSCYSFSSNYAAKCSNSIKSDSPQPINNTTETYLVMDNYLAKSNNGPYFEHTRRVYRCHNCGYYTKLVTFCPTCTGASSDESVALLSRLEPNALSQTICPPRPKTQSLIERPKTCSLNQYARTSRISAILAQQPPRNINRIANINFPQSVSFKTSSSPSSSITDEPHSPSLSNDQGFYGVGKNTANLSDSSSNVLPSDSSKLSLSNDNNSQSSLSALSNRHDNDIFMDIDFNNLHCYSQLLQKQHSEPKSSKFANTINVTCTNCYHGLQSLSYPSSSSSNNKASIQRFCNICRNDLVVMIFLLDDQGFSQSNNNNNNNYNINNNNNNDNGADKNYRFSHLSENNQYQTANTDNSGYVDMRLDQNENNWRPRTTSLIPLCNRSKYFQDCTNKSKITTTTTTEASDVTIATTTTTTSYNSNNEYVDINKNISNTSSLCKVNQIEY